MNDFENLDFETKAERRERQKHKYIVGKDHTSDHFLNPSKKFKQYLEKRRKIRKEKENEIYF